MLRIHDCVFNYLKPLSKYSKFEKVCDRYVIESDGSYTIWEISDSLLIFKTDNSLYSMEVIYLKKLPLEILIEKLKSIDDFYFLMVVNNNGVDIYKSLSRGSDYYYLENGFFLTTELSDIKGVLGPNSNNIKFNLAYLDDAINTPFLSPYKKSKKIIGGCLTRFRLDGISIEPFISLEPLKKNYFDTLSELIYKKSKNKKIWLNFSSGLDSTLLFLILKECGLQFDAIYHGSTSEESDSEFHEALELCKKYDVKIHLRMPGPVTKNNIKEISHPSDIW